MRALSCLLLLVSLAPGFAHAEKATFEDGRFSLEFPADWKKTDGPNDGHLLHREAPKGAGSFSVFTLKIKKDYRADLQGTLKTRVEAIAEAGMTVTGDVEGQEGSVDGKKAIFAVVPVQAKHAEQVVNFRYYLVFIDAVDTVVILQATLPSPSTPALQKTALGVIESFKEKEKEKQDE